MVEEKSHHLHIDEICSRVSLVLSADLICPPVSDSMQVHAALVSQNVFQQTCLGPQPLLTLLSITSLNYDLSLRVNGFISAALICRFDTQGEELRQALSRDAQRQRLRVRVQRVRDPARLRQPLR